MIAAQTLTLPNKGLSKAFSSSAFQILAASLFLAFCAQISIPLYFTPVPLTGQVFGILFVSAILGPRKGALAVLAYLAEGCLGLPVFAGGSFGAACLFGTNGGYFLGFIVQAYLAGLTVKKSASFSSAKIATGLFLSCVACLALGSLWLSRFVGLSAAITLGFYPFLLGDLVKTLCVTAYLKSRHDSQTNSHLSR